MVPDIRWTNLKTEAVTRLVKYFVYYLNVMVKKNLKRNMLNSVPYVQG